MQFFTVIRAIGCVVFVEAGHDAVAITGYLHIQFSLGPLKPVGYPNGVVGVLTHAGTHVEVAVAKRVAVHSRLHPIVVHAECTQNDLAVRLSQALVERFDALDTQIQENGIDNLHNVEPSQGRENLVNVPEISHRVPLAK